MFFFLVLAAVHGMQGDSRDGYQRSSSNVVCHSSKPRIGEVPLRLCLSSPSGHIICSTCIDTHSRPSKCYLCSHPIVKAGEWSRTMQPAIEQSVSRCERLGSCSNLPGLYVYPNIASSKTSRSDVLVRSFQPGSRKLLTASESQSNLKDVYGKESVSICGLTKS